MQFELDTLLQYTEWERQRWYEAFLKHGAAALAIPAGPNGDGRFATVGDFVRHIFSAEMRYVERLKSLPLSDTNAIPNDDVEALFAYGRESRAALRQLLETFPADQWDVAREFTILSFAVTVTPRKIVMHVVMHEIRHWAQIATLLRLNGIADGFHDLLGAPVMGGSMRPAETAAT